MMYSKINAEETNCDATFTFADWLGTSSKARSERKKLKKEAELHSIVEEASSRAAAARTNGRKKTANSYGNMAAMADKEAARLMRERVDKAAATMEEASPYDKEAKFIKGIVIAGGAALTAYVAYNYIKDNMQSFKELANALVK